MKQQEMDLGKIRSTIKPSVVKPYKVLMRGKFVATNNKQHHQRKKCSQLKST